MPRGRLNERYVQCIAVEWLAKRYQSTLGTRAVVAEIEVVVSAKTKLGRGRADGLIVAQLSDGMIYTASVEAKSARTLSSLSWWYRDDDKQWLLHSLLVGGLGLMVAGVIGWSIGTWFWTFVFPILTFFVVGFVYLLLTVERYRSQTIDVISQAKRYPANEQWVALSSDAYNDLGRDFQQALHTNCQKEGIGLIQVRSGANVTPLETAKPKALPKGYTDFLVCYARSATMRQRLRAKAEKDRPQQDE